MIIQDNLQKLLQGLFQVLPNVAGAIAILLIGWLVSRLIRKSLSAFLRKLKMDRFAESINASDFLSKSRFRIVPSEIISAIVYYFLVLIFLVASTDVLGLESLSKLIQDIINWIPNLVTAMAMLFIGFLAADFLKNASLKACESLGVPSGKFISLALFYFILINIVVSALAQAKVNTQFIATNISILIAGLALSFSIGYGFASKDVVANFLVSFYSKDKIQVGQRVRVDDVTGVITDIGKTSLTIDCGDREVIIPLNKLSKEKIEIFNS